MAMHVSIIGFAFMAAATTVAR